MVPRKYRLSKYSWIKSDHIELVGYIGSWNIIFLYINYYLVWFAMSLWEIVSEMHLTFILPLLTSSRHSIRVLKGSIIDPFIASCSGSLTLFLICTGALLSELLNCAISHGAKDVLIWGMQFSQSARWLRWVLQIFAAKLQFIIVSDWKGYS